MWGRIVLCCKYCWIVWSPILLLYEWVNVLKNLLIFVSGDFLVMHTLLFYSEMVLRSCLVSSLLLEKLWHMFSLECMAVWANLALGMLFSLYFSFSLLASLSSVWMNSYRKAMAWVLVSLCSLLLISGKHVKCHLSMMIGLAIMYMLSYGKLPPMQWEHHLEGI